MNKEDNKKDNKVAIRLTDEQRKLVEANEKLVYAVAKKYAHIPRHAYEDLLMRLYYRLCVSVAKFEPSRGFAISTFLYKTLQGEAKNFFRDDMWVIKIPRSLRSNNFARIVSRVESDLSEAEIHGHNPESIRTCALPISLDILTDQEELYSNPEEIVMKTLGEEEIIEEVITNLSPDEACILSMIMNDLPISDIRKHLNVSRSCAMKIISEVKENAGNIYNSISNGDRPKPSPGSKTLSKVFMKYFTPPKNNPVELRCKVINLNRSKSKKDASQ